MERETLYSVAKHVRLQYLLHMWAIFSVANSQCGNFMIFLLLRFYVKSILRVLGLPKLPFFAISGVVNFVNLVNFNLQKL